MRKIDLHIHTVSSNKDREFNFNMEKLKQYITNLKLDCIAITNHNLFNLIQFQEITKNIDILVLPGIEIDYKSGHLLLISENKNIDDFSDKCKLITEILGSGTKNINFEKLNKIFGDLNEYILIPHYEKDPALNKREIQEIKPYITAGEVSSAKKFINCIKTEKKLTPCYFSDIRISDDLESFPLRFTYIDLNEIDFSKIRITLNNKNKVFLSENDGNKFFQVFDNGFKLSTSLNVILGARSSGKTYTLNKINSKFDNVKYIKQFSLLESNEDKDKEAFEKIIRKNQSIDTEDFLKEFKECVDDVIDICLDDDNYDIEEYLASLKKNAQEHQLNDVYSSTKLFHENEYLINDSKGIKELISAAELLLNNRTYDSIINKYISKDNIKNMIIALINEYQNECFTNLKKKYINNIIRNIKEELQLKSNYESIKSLDVLKISMNRIKIKKFKKVVTALKKEKEFKKIELNKFIISAKSKQFEGAQGMKSLSRSQTAFSGAFREYNHPYEFLQELKKLGNLEKTELYKYFVDIKYEVLNSHGFNVSGGERSEFRLLQEIRKAKQADLLLIDEPESSFDNIFLKEDVNQIIRDISTKTPVVIVTHNNTVGASISPNYLIYTEREIDEKTGDAKYYLYSGHPLDKELVSCEGKKIKNRNVLLDCLEAGDDAYNNRRKTYETLKDL
ncbi:MAG: PHP domain-containing protein [Pleomorphochaeta sp.]